MIEEEALDHPVVIHSVPLWLQLTATYLYNQVRFLPPEISSHIACATTENLDQFEIDNIHSMERDSKWRFSFQRVFPKWRQHVYRSYLVSLGRKHRARILHSHWGDVAWRNIAAAKKLGLAHIVTFYGKDVNYVPRLSPRWMTRYEELFRHVKAVVCEGPHMAECLVRLGCPKWKVHVCHLGVELRKIKFKPRSWDDSRPLRLLMAASFREKKGIPYALQALGAFKDELPEFEITIIGDASEDQRSHLEKTKILQALDKYDLVKRTRLLGYQPHAVVLAEAYRHHIFISPSLTAHDGDTEGGAPVTLIEMAATGMPVVSTTHCDIPSVVIHGRTGLLAPEGDPNGLFEHLRWLVRNPDGWCSIVEAAREHLEREYDVVRQARKLADIYLEVDSMRRF